MKKKTEGKKRAVKKPAYGKKTAHVKGGKVVKVTDGWEKVEIGLELPVTAKNHTFSIPKQVELPLKVPRGKPSAEALNAQAAKNLAQHRRTLELDAFLDYSSRKWEEVKRLAAEAGVPMPKVVDITAAEEIVVKP